MTSYCVYRKYPRLHFTDYRCGFLVAFHSEPPPAWDMSMWDKVSVIHVRLLRHTERACAVVFIMRWQLPYDLQQGSSYWEHGETLNKTSTLSPTSIRLLLDAFLCVCMCSYKEQVITLNIWKRTCKCLRYTRLDLAHDLCLDSSFAFKSLQE